MFGGLLGGGMRERRLRSEGLEICGKFGADEKEDGCDADVEDCVEVEGDSSSMIANLSCG